MKKPFILGLFLVAQIFAQFALANPTSAQNQSVLCKEVKRKIRSGDLVFTAVDSFVFEQVARDTETWTSHVGVAFFDAGERFVYESKIPLSVATPICDFVERSLNEQVEVRRYHSRLNKNTLKQLKFGAEDRLGYYYDTGFNFENENRMYCSKFAFQVYADVGIQVGKIETMKELLESNPNANIDFWQTWYLGRIPWERKIVTPASLLRDSKFATIYSNNVKIANNQSLQ